MEDPVFELHDESDFLKTTDVDIRIGGRAVSHLTFQILQKIINNEIFVVSSEQSPFKRQIVMEVYFTLMFQSLYQFVTLIRNPVSTLPPRKTLTRTW